MSFNRVFLSCVFIVASLMIATPSWGQSTVTVTFDGPPTPTVASFGTATSHAIEAGPADTGSADGNALRITKPAGDPEWAGAIMLDLPAIVSTDGNQTVTARVHSTVAVPIIINVEFGEGTPGDVYSAAHGGGGWEDLSWTVTSFDPVNTYNRFVIRPEFPAPVNGGTYYIDNFSYTGVDVPDPLASYEQDFEPPMPLGSETGNSGLSDDAWKYFVNVFGPSGEAPALYNYNGDVPNNFTSFANVAGGQGGPAQGDQQLTVFSDYGNADHTNSSGNRIEVNVFQQPPNLNSSDVGNKYYLRFDAKRGNIGGATTAAAFIKTLDPNNGFALTNNPVVHTTSLPTEWGTYCTSLAIDSGLDGQIIQFGFTNTASNEEDSGVFYDNVTFGADTSGFTDTDLDGLFDCEDPDDDNDGTPDIVDRDPLVADNVCTAGFDEGDDRKVTGETISTTRTCTANESVTVDASTQIVDTGPGDLRVVSKKVVMSDMSVGPAPAAMQVYNLDPVCEDPGCPIAGAEGELAVNGDVETGTLEGWTEFPNGGVISVVSPGAGGSNNAVKLDASGAAIGVTIKQANLGAGSVVTGQQVTVSFDWKGMDADGGVADARLFQEISPSGVSDTDIIPMGGPFPADWTTVGPLVFPLDNDVSGGVTLEVTAICGGAPSCVSVIELDNVSVIVSTP